MLSRSFRIFGSLLLLPLIYSAPTPQDSSPAPVCQATNFDSFPTSLVNTNFIREYQNIYWQGMTVGSSTFQITGVKANSGNNVAAWSVDSRILQGPPSMLADYPGSKTESFDLCGFAFGCALPTLQGAFAIPSGCFITITGYVLNSDKTVQRKIYFEPTGLRALMAETEQGIFSEFKNLKKVTFKATGFLGLSTTVVGLIDDVKYTVKLKGA